MRTPTSERFNSLRWFTGTAVLAGLLLAGAAMMVPGADSAPKAQSEAAPTPAGAEAAVASPESVAEAKKTVPIPKRLKHNLAPLPAGEKPVASHAPYEADDCTLCHKNADPKNPGPILKPVNQLCLECHDDFQAVLSRKSQHAAATESCNNCHNPHNARHPKLLVEANATLCLSCHEDIKTVLTQSKVKHDAVTMDAQCSNCHNPHGANVEHLLTRLPFDLCVNCHSKDDLKDDQGKTLTNFKKLLEDNPEHHGPVAMQDCSACHKPHGSDAFRLLLAEYPPQFYSPYDPKLYALCFECHEDNMLHTPETTTLTKFRDGNKNLHYLHVHKDERGRTCRACHEVHASKQKHQIRDGVPYGSKGWMLKINYTKTATGGSCAKTCHDTKSYTNVSASPEKKAD